MLRNIDFQISSDTNEQQTIEATVTPIIKRKFQINLNAISVYSQELAEKLHRHPPAHYSPFITRKKHLNIVNVHKGRALYDVVPNVQVNQQLSDFQQRGLLVNSETMNSCIEPNEHSLMTIEQRYPGLEEQYTGISSESDSLMILGCGLGLHIEQLLQMKVWKHVLLIEPEWDLLAVSLYSAQWLNIVNYLQNQDCKLTFIIGETGQQMLHSVKEWQQQTAESHFFLFKHYNYIPFNALEWGFATRSLSFENIDKIQWRSEDEDRDYECCYSMNHFMGSSFSSQQLAAIHDTLLQRQQNNLLAFAEHMPDIYAQSLSYQQQRWQLLLMPNGEVNLFDSDYGVCLFSKSPKQESQNYFEHYSSNPKLEALDARKGLRKPSPYIHYKRSDELKELVSSLPTESRTKLPQRLPSFIMYGCGAGYQIEHLLLSHDIDYFILYEPNIDYFMASMYLIDWQAVLHRVEENEQHIYLNIGDDGSNMFSDLHTKLQQQGINILSYTFFYVSYFHKVMDTAIRSTREQFRVLMNIGEYFDHAMFNISHTNEAFRRGHHHLLKRKTPEITKLLADTPLFIVGNGPSLDASIEHIRRHQGHAIIISCGTCLKTLHKLGIKPDFHAEVEQTRATVEWIEQVNDPEWVKSIDLMSVNGVHPDVTALFNDALICFKRGEAATLMYQDSVPETNLFEDILYSYPTVSNSALAYALKLGFKQIYLFGIDLGFKDPTQHHSKHSAYFHEKTGKELYNYAKHGTGLRVQGNFQEWVNTKFEFRFAREVMEETIAEYPDVDVFNCSDGAYIGGTQPLNGDDVIANKVVDKSELKTKLKSDAYTIDTSKLYSAFKQQYQPQAFADDCQALLKQLDEKQHNWQEVLALLNNQLLFVQRSSANKHSLFFALLRGSASFSLTYLTRLAFSSEDEDICIERFEQGKQIWREYVEEAKEYTLNRADEWDVTSQKASWDRQAKTS
ncbi:motility associated factor glycosyltransferase family protein [Agarivorans sp. MS3-6]